MSVLLNTCAGDIVIDLHVDDCPVACKNFLKLCKVKYYNNCLLYNVQPNLLLQTGDPTGTGKGGVSLNGLLRGDPSIAFNDEIIVGRKLNKVGMVCMAHYGGKENSNRSQFFITLRGEDLEHIEKTHSIFGEVAEGLDVLHILNNLYCDEDQRPYQDVRIRHTFVLDDPFPDPPGLVVPPESPKASKPEGEKVKTRLAYRPPGEVVVDQRSAEEIEASIREKEAKSRAIILEMTGDLPDADVKPPEEVLFICKLNPVTTDEDLELIFSRFGAIKSCEVIRDFKTGDSLSFAFIEFETEAACVQAYEKMNNVLIDDRRIKVDFSQSVSKLWNRFLAEPRKAPPSGGSKRFSFPSRPQSGGPPPMESPPSAQKKHRRDESDDHHRRRRDASKSRSPVRDSRDRRGSDHGSSGGGRRRDDEGDTSSRHKGQYRDRSRSRERGDKESRRREDSRDRKPSSRDHQHHRRDSRDESRDRRNHHKEDRRDRDRDDRDSGRDHKHSSRRDSSRDRR